MSSLIEIFVPAPCVCCEAPLPGGLRALCPSCQASIVPFAGTRCPTCGGPNDDNDEPCLSCAGSPSALTATVIWGEYDGVLRDTILAFKHHRHDELSAPLSLRLAARVSLEDWTGEIDIVTAVPSHAAHHLRRGYTAANLVAADIAGRLDRPYRRTLRRHGIARQVGKTRKQRQGLSKRRFSVTAKRHVAGANLLLVDDVWTTGSTMRLAAETLRRGGARRVYGAVLAAAPDARSFA